MTKQTYKNNIKRPRAALVAKYGETHIVIVSFDEQVSVFTDPTEEYLNLMIHCYFALMRYGYDLEWN